MGFNTPKLSPPGRLPYSGQTTDAVEIYRARQAERQGRLSTIHTFLGPAKEVQSLGDGTQGKTMLG